MFTDEAGSTGPSIAAFINDAVSHLGFGLEGLSDSTVNDTYSGSFTTNGRAATITFTSTPVVYPTNPAPVVREGATGVDGADADTFADTYTENETEMEAMNLWEVTVAYDGPDTDTDGAGVDTDTDYLVISKISKLVSVASLTPAPTATPVPTVTPTPTP